MAAIGETVSGLLGKESMARQFFVWSVASTVVSTALEPFLTALANDVNSHHPEKPLSPADLADMVVRGIMVQGEAEKVALKSGVSTDDFGKLVLDTGEPPSVLDMLLLYRRGKVTHDQVVKAIRQSRVRDEWVDTLFELGVQPPSPADIIDATLKGQIDEVAGRELYAKLGGDPEYYKLMVDTVGDAPSPDQAASMARRGIIPWDGVGPGVTSYEQAVREGRARIKWTAAYRAAAQYVPPPRTITAMHTSGALSDAEATKLLKQAGVPDPLIPTYLKDSSAAKKQKHKDLAESTLSQLYQDQAIGDDAALSGLEALGYGEPDGKFIILTWQLARKYKALQTAVNTVHSKYIGHHIDDSKASLALDQLHVPSAQRDFLIATWNQERAANVTLLTAAEIKKANKAGIFTDDEALARLTSRGYTPEDAQIYLII